MRGGGKFSYRPNAPPRGVEPATGKPRIFRSVDLIQELLKTRTNKTKKDKAGTTLSTLK